AARHRHRHHPREGARLRRERAPPGRRPPPDPDDEAPRRRCRVRAGRPGGGGLRGCPRGGRERGPAAGHRRREHGRVRLPPRGGRRGPGPRDGVVRRSPGPAGRALEGARRRRRALRPHGPPPDAAPHRLQARVAAGDLARALRAGRGLARDVRVPGLQDDRGAGHRPLPRREDHALRRRDRPVGRGAVRSRRRPARPLAAGARVGHRSRRAHPAGGAEALGAGRHARRRGRPRPHLRRVRRGGYGPRGDSRLDGYRRGPPAHPHRAAPRCGRPRPRAARRAPRPAREVLRGGDPAEVRRPGRGAQAAAPGHGRGPGALDGRSRRARAGRGRRLPAAGRREAGLGRPALVRPGRRERTRPPPARGPRGPHPQDEPRPGAGGVGLRDRALAHNAPRRRGAERTLGAAQGRRLEPPGQDRLRRRVRGPRRRPPRRGRRRRLQRHRLRPAPRLRGGPRTVGPTRSVPTPLRGGPRALASAARAARTFLLSL
ncbi:MAG: hypothetical protein AVDCRST_MAG05-272, partial [uncultured Rubrobacteraceae bacterium]